MEELAGRVALVTGGSRGIGAAWRAYGGFEGRSSVRTWLYRIATNACLTATARRAGRPLASGLGAPGGDPDPAAGAGPRSRGCSPFPTRW